MIELRFSITVNSTLLELFDLDFEEKKMSMRKEREESVWLLESANK